MRSTKGGIRYKIYGRVDKFNDLSDMQIAEMKISNSQNDRPAFYAAKRESEKIEMTKLNGRVTLKSDVDENMQTYMRTNQAFFL